MRRSKFVLSHDHSTTLDMGKLVPFLLIPTLPGDRFRISLSSFIRCQPMVAPLMHVVHLYTQYWYVPYRILWEDWEDFITGGENLEFSPDSPQISSGADGFASLSLADYFGFPVDQPNIKVSAFPFRAMAEIWNTRYRDEDLQSEVPISYGSGLDSTTSTDLLSPSWKRDYFTTSRPFTQRGADIMVPITTGEGVSVFHEHTYTVTFFCPFAYVGYSTYSAVANAMYSGSTLTIEGSSGVGNGTWKYDDDPLAFLTALELSMFGNRSTTASRIEVTSDALPVTSEQVVNAIKSGPLKSGSVSVGSKAVWVAKCYNSANLVESIATLDMASPCAHYSLDADRTVPNLPETTPFTFSNVRIVYSYGFRWTYSLAFNGLQELPSTDFQKYSLKIGVTLQQTGAVSIRDIRASSALQRYAERSLKWGNRYEEFIAREFGVSPRDSRIQRPEYLGGGRGVLSISEVLQTAESEQNSVGTMRGHGVSSVSQKRIRFMSPEHGLIIGLLSIRPVPVYTQGIDREWIKRSRLDYFTPEFADIGMQEVLQQELFATADNVDKIFGYSERYQEYRYMRPRVTGEFRKLLNFWNLARNFDTPPNLNDEFINMAYDTELFKRPFAVQDESYSSFLAMLRNNVVAFRPVPKKAKDILR